MKVISLVDEMINIVSLRSIKNISIQASSFSDSTIDPVEIYLGCSRILQWIYYDGNDPFRPFWIERSGHLEKSFLEFMNLDLIKEFFIMENGNFAFNDSVTQVEANEITQFVKKNFNPVIFDGLT
jgi:hypothetical protein